MSDEQQIDLFDDNDNDSDNGGTQTISQSASDEVVLVKLRKKYGSLFPGEIGGFPSHIAAGLIGSGGAYPLDDNGQAIIPPGEDMPQPLSPPLNNFAEPGSLVDDDSATGDVGQPKRGRKSRKAADNSQPASGSSTFASSATPVADELIKPFLADGLDRDVAAALYNFQLTTPDLVAEALAAGRDLSEEISGIGPKTFAELKTLYGDVE